MLDWAAGAGAGGAGAHQHHLLSFWTILDMVCLDLDWSVAGTGAGAGGWAGAHKGAHKVKNNLDF